MDLHYLYVVIICLKVEILGNYLRRPHEDYMGASIDIILSLIHNGKCDVD